MFKRTALRATKKTPLSVKTGIVSFFLGSRPQRKGGSDLLLPLSLVVRCVSDCGPTFGRQTCPRTRSAVFSELPCNQRHACGPDAAAAGVQNNCVPAFWRPACHSRSNTFPAAGSFGSPFCPPDRANTTRWHCGAVYSAAAVSQRGRYRRPVRHRRKTPLVSAPHWYGHGQTDAGQRKRCHAPPAPGGPGEIIGRVCGCGLDGNYVLMDMF